MSPETRAVLQSKLAENGLTVLKTDDYNSTLLQLSRLARFERLMLNTAAGNPVVETAVEHVRSRMDGAVGAIGRSPLQRPDPARRMEIDDIPMVLRSAHSGLHNYLSGDATLIDPAALPEIIDHALEIARSGRALNNPGYIRTGLLNAAVFALVGVISIDRLCEGKA